MTIHLVKPIKPLLLDRVLRGLEKLFYILFIKKSN